ncbi:MAG: prolyl oligopeptidase family serine peptidase [Kiritimatiellia bacterium]|jgi:predicted esterase|nr:prolyl oligopeptidase family serine peptidase [Kiritimatiellia bacterium]
MKYVVKLSAMLLILSVGFLSAEEEKPFPGKKGQWHGFDQYSWQGKKVVVPKNVADGKPWVIRARFWGHEPQFDFAMLNKGYHVVYCNIGGLYGAPEAVKRWDEFYKFLTEEHGFAKKGVLEGMSRGGLIIYNWGIANPTKVAAIYGDAPVMDFKSWPGAGSGGIHKAYGFKSEDEANAYKGNPVDNMAPLAKAKVPIIHVVGDADKVVPVAENTAVAEKRYKELGGLFRVIHKEGVGHHPHSLKDPTPIVEFIEKNVEGK